MANKKPFIDPISHANMWTMNSWYRNARHRKSSHPCTYTNTFAIYGSISSLMLTMVSTGCDSMYWLLSVWPGYDCCVPYDTLSTNKLYEFDFKVLFCWIRCKPIGFYFECFSCRIFFQCFCTIFVVIYTFFSLVI